MEGGLGEQVTDGELVIRCLLEGSSAGWADGVSLCSRLLMRFRSMFESKMVPSVPY